MLTSLIVLAVIGWSLAFALVFALMLAPEPELPLPLVPREPMPRCKCLGCAGERGRMWAEHNHGASNTA